METVLGVVGGSGGVGATRFAAVLAAVAARAAGRSLLVDLDPVGGGVDVALGAERVAGPRWSGLRLAGGVLDSEVLLSGLPTWGRTAVLACDQLPPPSQVSQVIGAGASTVPVVLDLGRVDSPTRSAALARCTCVVLVTACDLAGVTAARSVAGSLGVSAPIALVVRGGRAPAARTAGLIGRPLAARLPLLRRRSDAALDPGRLPPAMQRVARGVLAGLHRVDPYVPVPAAWLANLELAS
jgi:hypothetical protein